MAAGGKQPPAVVFRVESRLILSRIASLSYRSTLFMQFSRSDLMPEHRHTPPDFAFPRDLGPASGLGPSSNSHAWTNNLHYSM